MAYHGCCVDLADGRCVFVIMSVVCEGVGGSCLLLIQGTGGVCSVSCLFVAACVV